MNRTEIIPNLWVGTLKSSQNKNLNTLTNIDVFINCENDLRFMGNHKKYNSHISTSIHNYETMKLHEYLHETTRFIHDNLKKNNSILVCCNNATQKSPLIATAYIIKYGEVSKNDAINMVKSKYNGAFYPKILYEYSLDKFLD